jgi:hypothetical protein
MPSAKEKDARRARGRRDPRAEQGAGDLVEEVAPSVRRDPRAEPQTIPPEAVSAAAGAASPVGGVDPRLAELEPLFARTAWGEIAERLGPAEKAAELPPALALIHALARREAAGEASAGDATRVAITAMAALLGAAPDSMAALILAKRLLRQNPAGWRTKPAPPARFSIAIIVLGLAVGAAVGWFASLGSIRLSLGSFRLF